MKKQNALSEVVVNVVDLKNNNMKQEITAQVVMLPTGKKTWDRGQLLRATDKSMIGIATSNHITGTNDSLTPQYLYFTTYEPIQGGDWYIWEGKLWKRNIEPAYPLSKKIVASTDPALGLPAIPLTWIRDVYVPSNGSIKKVSLQIEAKYDTTTGMFARFGLVFDDNGCVVIVDEPKVNGWSVKELAETAVATLEKEFEAIDNKSIETLFPKEQCGDLSVDQELEDAANNWIDLHYNKGVEYSKSKRGAANPKSGFIAGAKWQKEQLSIPTYEEISNIASEYAIEKCRIMQQIRCLTARKTAYIDGYKQALKDLGYADN